MSETQYCLECNRKTKSGESYGRAYCRECGSLYETNLVADREKKIAEIREALEKATQGPWKIADTTDGYVLLDADDRELAFCDSIRRVDDVCFIANAPEWLQWAVQEIERLREENEGRKKIIEAYMRIEHDLAEDVERIQSEVSRLRLRDSLLEQLHAQIADYFGGEGGLAKLQDGVHTLKAEIGRLQEERSKLIEVLRWYAERYEMNGSALLLADLGQRARDILKEIGVNVE